MSRLHFGGYIHRASVLHRAHPAVKFLSALLVISIIGAGRTWQDAAGGLAVLLVTLSASRIAPAELWSVIRPFRWLLIITLILHLFFNQSLGFIPRPGVNELLMSATITTRFLLMIAFSSLLTLTTTPVDMVRVFYAAVRPFQRFGLNAKDLALSMLIALRFIPLLFEEAERIATAQKLRGIIPVRGLSVITRMEAFLFPLFTRVMHYAEQISVTLRFRGDLQRVLLLPPVERGHWMLFLCSVLLSLFLLAIPQFS